MDSKSFGIITQVEIGALLVGKIVNHPLENNSKVSRMQEKGYFLFGGSTVILALEKGRVLVDSDLEANSLKGLETKVSLGETVARKIFDTEEQNEA